MRTKCNKVNTAAEKKCNKGQGKKKMGVISDGQNHPPNLCINGPLLWAWGSSMIRTRW